MDWPNLHSAHDFAVDDLPPLGALRAVLAAAERLGVAPDRLLAAAEAEAETLDDVDRAAIARLNTAPPKGEEFVARVRAAIESLLAESRLGVEDVAKQLAVSARTLQRRLERAGTTYGKVYDRARRDVALTHLRNPRLPIKETAFRLGFSEPSTFYRAFRRWTGATPASYRRSFASCCGAPPHTGSHGASENGDPAFYRVFRN